VLVAQLLVLDSWTPAGLLMQWAHALLILSAGKGSTISLWRSLLYSWIHPQSPLMSSCMRTSVGHLVHVPAARGSFTPQSLSSRLDFPADWLPHTTRLGRVKLAWAPASRSWLTSVTSFRDFSLYWVWSNVAGAELPAVGVVATIYRQNGAWQWCVNGLCMGVLSPWACPNPLCMAHNG